MPRNRRKTILSNHGERQRGFWASRNSPCNSRLFHLTWDDIKGRWGQSSVRYSESYIYKIYAWHYKEQSLVGVFLTFILLCRKLKYVLDYVMEFSLALKCSSCNSCKREAHCPKSFASSNSKDWTSSKVKEQKRHLLIIDVNPKTPQHHLHHSMVWNTNLGSKFGSTNLTNLMLANRHHPTWIWWSWNEIKK